MIPILGSSSLSPVHFLRAINFRNKWNTTGKVPLTFLNLLIRQVWLGNDIPRSYVIVLIHRYRIGSLKKFHKKDLEDTRHKTQLQQLMQQKNASKIVFCLKLPKQQILSKVCAATKMHLKYKLVKFMDLKMDMHFYMHTYIHTFLCTYMNMCKSPYIRLLSYGHRVIESHILLHCIHTYTHAYSHFRRIAMLQCNKCKICWQKLIKQNCGNVMSFYVRITHSHTHKHMNLCRPTNIHQARG